jgi:hypothetical protein
VAPVRLLLPGADTPFTVIVLIIVVAASLLMRSGPDDHPEITQWASTNLVNLRDHPVSALLSSIVATPDGMSWLTIVFGVAGSVLERQAGVLRAAAIPLAGQIIATMLSEGGVRLAIRARTDDLAAAFQVDVGISYVAFTAAAAALRYLPRTWRSGPLAVLAAWVLIPLALDADMTSWGHVLSVGVGLLCWHWLPAPDRTAAGPHRPARPRPGGMLAASVSRAASTATLTALAVTGLVWVGGGTLLT